MAEYGVAVGKRETPQRPYISSRNARQLIECIDLKPRRSSWRGAAISDGFGWSLPLRRVGRGLRYLPHEHFFRWLCAAPR
jgi:hypothetical protein